MKKYIIISDFSLTARNRGTAALGYGSLAFLREKGYMEEGQEVICYRILRNPFRCSFFRKKSESINVQGTSVTFNYLTTSVFEYKLWKKFGISFPFSAWGKMVRNLALVAAINGGDGFSDIYGVRLYNSRLWEIKLAKQIKVPVILLPQTIGPFKDPKILEEAKQIMEYASAVYVRDSKYTKELDKMGIKYELTNDLSAYMKPEPWDIDIKPGSIGINVSGLAYSNNFRDLAGKFAAYPELMTKLVQHFQKKGKTVYLIPHAYGYNNPEWDNDDMISSREFYNSLEDKTNVVLIDKDLISPQVKYVISRMSFFIGTRMHANFAAIFTKVPVFGLAYSFKFQGAFENNGIYNRTAMINNITSADIPGIIDQIDKAYEEDVGEKRS
ncbi:polysaccharide pyruvyl transferase family protein [Fibrobacter sp. UWB10]|uniref:polysaccharide pyruvyl transferase family protein n=1 Tax=Fibrobacter sp. UWB10 TaxID=1896201 RepID=UPI002402EDB6|nr:polysaccharide pyruvyl transferase family protein [Fibrobacter sp. UWB10]SMP47389.1 Polysaccharide pyruvyl transferase [Fibrobacter sp. UWB10]